MKRQDVTDLIAFRKVTKGIKWSEVAARVGQSKEWVTAGLPRADDAEQKNRRKWSARFSTCLRTR
ncbi:MAG: hypothetical protein WDN04_01235 [Rhodospirillales bacterium]